MLTPTSGTIADYHSAILAGNPTHTRITFPVQSVVLTDDNISVDGGIQMTAIMNTEDDLVFGKAVSTEVKIFLLNGNVFSGFDWTEEFKIEFGVEISGTTNWVVVGWFKGTKPERTIRTDVIEFVAYDRMQAFDVLADEFLASVTYPVTMQTLFQNLCTYCGVGYAVGSEMADSMAVSYAEDPFADGITCRTLLAWIAEANCTVAKINADGDVVLAWYTDQTATYSIDENHYFDINISENTVSPIDCVDINSTDTEISGFIYPVSGTNPYHIIDNPLLMFLGAATKTTIITNMITRLSALANYIPTAVAAFGNWLVETGDIISVGYDNGSTMNMPVFNKVFMWAGASEDTYECTGKAERTALTGSAKDDYVLGGKLSNKYTIVTGVDIDDDGITVSGAKYVRIRSGGTLDVQSTNFIIDSDVGYLASIVQYANGSKFRVGLGDVPNSLVSDEVNFTIQQAYIQHTVFGTDYDEYPAILSHYDFRTVPGTEIVSSLRVGVQYYDASGHYNSLLIGESIKNNQIDKMGFRFDFGEVNEKFAANEINGYTFTGNGVKNNLTTTGAGYVLDARAGATLDGKISAVATDLYNAANYDLSKKIYLDSSAWSNIWAKINKLTVGESATITIGNAALQTLSGGVYSSGTPTGVITKTSSSAFDMVWATTGPNLIAVRMTGVSSSSAGTFSYMNVNDKFNALPKDDIVYQSSATTHTFTVASNSRNFVIAGGDGLSYTYIGFVYGSSNGTVTHTDLYAGSRVQAIGVQTNKISFTLSQASSYYLRSVNLRGDIIS